jgi:hypothetical protein
MDKIVNIQNVDPNTFQLQNYSVEDESLISNFTQQDIIFNPSEDYLEYFILDFNENVLYQNVAGYPNYTLRDNLVTIDPQNDLESQGFTEGQYYTVYNFLKRKLSSSPNSTFYIQDISSDRTELRLNTTQISNIDVADLTIQLANQIANSTGVYLDFALNFGENKLVIANNIALDNTNPNDPTVLIKLYDPLPDEFIINSQCWVVEQIAESQAYQIELTTIFSPEEEFNYIGGPNFNLEIQDQINNSTPYFNQNILTQNYSSLGSGSLLYQINSILAEKGIEINIDYTDYSNFIHFSSAQTRLENFYYKLSLIEQYNYSASYSDSGLPLNLYTSGSQIIWQNKIDDIITNFDGYEYYLYYESSSYAWPKTNSIYPYVNELTTSVPALNWFTTQSISASLYDEENMDILTNTIPNYLIDDPNNDQYKLFIQMIGQNFDNVWVYLKDITNKFDADNRLNYGISKDIVAQAIRDLGVKIYQNNFSTNDLYSALLGITPSGSLYNLPYTTGSLPTPSGYEYVNTFITASATSSLEPVDDINKEIYKRIYHNLPALLKKKGTTEGLNLLLNIYGIPDTIVRINEFGGKSYQDQSWDNFIEQFNYAFYSEGNGYISTNLDDSENSLNPTTIQFRFKTNGIPPTSPYSELLWWTVPAISARKYITLTYSGTGYTSGSYSGSIPDTNNEYATLEFFQEFGGGSSCTLSLPFYNGEWWSVMLTLDGTNATLYAANNIYEGYDGSNIGFIASSSTTSPSFITPATQYLSNSTFRTVNGKTCYPFSGSFQEWRVYYYSSSADTLNVDAFKDYTMNPYSIEGNSQIGSNSTPNSLYFRAPLGTMLDNNASLTTRESIHPAISFIPPTESFTTSGNSNYILNGTFTFEPNTETIYQNQFVAGIKNSVSEKIRIVDMVLPSGSTLSQYISIQQYSPANETFTKDVNYVEAAFSPQDEINDDIIAQLGYFNIGSYIGDPRQLLSLTTSGSLNYYPDFNRLRDYYFSKYTHNYDLNDYIRLIKFYDNSLFKMIKDFTPARAGLASGLVIKQTLLERCRYPQPRANTQSTIAFVGSPTSKILNIPN